MMSTIQWIITTAPEIFLLLAIAIGTVLGLQKFYGFAVGTTACILVVSVIMGQLGTFTIPSVLKALLFSMFVFTIGYRSGPRGLAIPVGLYEFARDEKLRLDWPLTGKPDKLELRLLDRYGQALKHKVTPTVVDTADGPHAIVEAVLSPLGRGDYVIELVVTRGADTESKVLAFRMK